MIDIPVQATIVRLLEQEDTDRDRRITVADRGPKRFRLDSDSEQPVFVEGTYALSNLLQELALARERGESAFQLDLRKLNQNPRAHVSELIRDRCWDGLTRRLDAGSLARVLPDPKFKDHPLRLFLAHDDAQAWHYYSALPAGQFELMRLPERVTPDYVLSLNTAPGLLGLAFGPDGQPLPYAVPGGRFNEMYGWDSYFIALGLLEDGKVGLARAMLAHQVYQIEHYGAILNANRTYYLTRSQPPFLTAFARALAAHDANPDWLRPTLVAAMHEYDRVWQHPSRLMDCGLSRYHCSGIGMPPETMMRHYGSILKPYADQAGMTVEAYRAAYERREAGAQALDDYFREDRAVRESGHDTSYRLEAVCTHLCTVDLNSLLYRYEADLAELLAQHFGGQLEGHPAASVWAERGALRQARMTALCWNQAAGQFFDYDWKRQCQTGFESCTNLFPLWAGLATPAQASRMVEVALPGYTVRGGLVSGSERSRGPVGPERTPRQWDYPYGWAPHQMLIWEGLRRYEFHSQAADLARRWLGMITQNAVDHNGVLSEKYDVVAASHEVHAEYQNIGADFELVVHEGFGWTNASYQLGQTYLSPGQLGELERIRASDAPAL